MDVPVRDEVVLLRLFRTRLIVVNVQIARLHAETRDLNGAYFRVRRRLRAFLNDDLIRADRLVRLLCVYARDVAGFNDDLVVLRVMFAFTRTRPNLVNLCDVRTAIRFIDTGVRRIMNSSALLLRVTRRNVGLLLILRDDRLIRFDLSKNCAILIRLRTIRCSFMRIASFLYRTTNFILNNNGLFGRSLGLLTIIFYGSDGEAML